MQNDPLFFIYEKNTEPSPPVPSDFKIERYPYSIRGNRRKGGKRMNYRHEWKHEINYADLLTLRLRLSAVMQQDEHTLGGVYRIRSLYFDNLYDKALREKIDGVDRREKFRIRYYNGDSSVIHLEKKSKWNALGTKDSVALTAAQAQSIVNGDIDWMLTAPDALVRELYDRMRTTGLRPRTIVDYTREPFVYAPGNVRITFDYDIRTGLQCTDFLDPHCLTVPVPDDPILLEVKWDEFLPSVIRDAIQLEGRQSSGYSKYAACRSFG